MKTLKRVLGGLGLIILALAVTAGGLVGYTFNRSFPQTSGTLKVPGLTGKVDVYRDGYGVPHIYAGNSHDLFLGQGYVHAQDRFYQMDFWRHQTSGRLAEMYGEGLADTDKFLRTVGWQRVAEQEYSLADAESKAALDAYAEGVNAYIASRPTTDLSLEYSILGLSGLSGYKPDPWTPVNSLAWAKALAWNLGRSRLDSEIKRAVLIQKVGREKTQEFMPLYPDDHPIIVPNPAISDLDFSALAEKLAAVDAVMGAGFESIGSNNWVIAGSRTSTGMPLLANDPHLDIQMPSIWYEVGLHCRTLSPACPYNVVGFSLAGDPGVILGHNNRIAWGATNLGPDVIDLYVEKINPANANQYEVNGQWEDMVVVDEAIRVKGKADEHVTIRYTRHGPLIADAFPAAGELTGPVNGVDLGPGYALAMRWTALEAGHIFRSVLRLDRAQNWNDFREALRDWYVPSQNFVYADVDGNIGYQAPGNIPIRKNGDGLLPVPGWTDEYEWTGYIPFEELPYSYNPPQGYIATANNAVVGKDYPYLLTLEWNRGYRAQRIVNLIEAQSKISPEYIQQMQGDDLNLGAKEILPYLLALQFDDPKLATASERLQGWDFQMHMDSQPAALYAAFLHALLADTFHDKLPERYWPQGGSDNWVTLRGLLANPNSSWWDNTTTPAVDTRDDILKQAFAEGYAVLEKQLGEDSNTWKWGALHTTTFENATLGSPASPAPIRALFNRGPYPASGSTDVVNATGWRANRAAADAFAVTDLPSMRMIVDLGDLDNSLTTHTTGQSGHAFSPHYADMIDPWRFIQYHPMLWSLSDIVKQAEAHLTLEP